MWYQSFWFTQLLIIVAITLAFLAFIYPRLPEPISKIGTGGQAEKKRWAPFIYITLLFLILSGTAIFFQVKHRQKLARFKVIPYHFKEIKDLSDFEADKYSATLVTEPNLTTPRQKEVILAANKQIIKSKSDASVIWIAVFDSDNAVFNQLDKQNPHFIAQSQWRRKNYVGLLPQSFVSNDNYKGIEIFFNHD